MIHFFKKKYPILLEVLILFIISLTPLIWFKPGYMVLGGDSGYPIDFVGFFVQRTFTWLSSYNFGLDMTAATGQIFLYGILAFVRTIGFSVYDVQKVTFIFWFFSICLSMYLLVRYLYPKQEFWLLRFTTVLIYAFNFHLFSFWIQGEQPTFSAYVLLPLVTYFLIKFFRNELTAFKTAVFLNLFFLVFNGGGVYGVPLLGSSIVSFITITVFFSLFLIKDEGWAYVKRFILFIIYLFIFFLVLNSYFILPFLTSFTQQYKQTFDATGGIDSILSWAKDVSKHDSYLNLFKLQGDSGWYENSYSYAEEFLNNPVLIFISILFPIFSYSSFLLINGKKEKKILLLFMLLSLVGIFFSAGVHPPFGFLYSFMLEHLPGFVAFRSAWYKFIPILYLSFAILIGVSVYYLVFKIKSKVKYIIAVCVLALIPLYHYPFFLKDNIVFDKPLSPMVKVPDYVWKFTNFSTNIPKDSRILVLPPFNQGYPLKAYKWGYWSASSFFPSITERSFVYYDGGLNQGENNLLSAAYQDLRSRDLTDFLKLAERMNVEYVLLTDDVANNFDNAPTENPDIYKEVINNKDYFDVVWKEGKWTLYRLKNNSTAKIYAIKSIDVYSGVTDSKILYLSSSPFITVPYINDETNNIKSYLPIESEIKNFTCVSCVLTSVKSEIKVNYSRVLPGSLLYPLKMFMEKQSANKISGDDQLTDFYIGLSLKRVSEINSLVVSDPRNIRISDLKKTLGLLSKYWKNIYEIAQKNYLVNQNFTEISKIDYYASFISGSLSGNYGKLFLTDDSSIKVSLANAMWRVEEVRKLLASLVDKNDWNSTFEYDVSQNNGNDLIISSASLPRNNLGEIISPSSYKVDDKILSDLRYSAGDVVLPNSNEKSTILTLYFKNIPSLASNLKEVTLNFPDRSENCLYSPVLDYSWQDTYFLSGSLKDTSQKVTVYVKRNHDEFITRRTQITDNGFFYSDAQPVLLTKTKEHFIYSFKGRQNDKNAYIYFCSSAANPKTEFYNISVKRAFLPIVYSLHKNILRESIPPKIEYTRVSPTKYSLHINGSQQKIMFGFKERFSALWKLYDSKSGKEIPSKHFILDGYANGWVLDKKGKIDLDVVFSPQKYSDFGIKISFVGAILIVAFLIIDAFHIFEKREQ